jgi:prepilin-type N-terminal cleavage/methylation domain-containing protein
MQEIIMKRESGFTLIEIIVTLVLVGILATVAGVGIVSAVKGYMLAKNNAAIAGKAQVALARMTREFMELRDVSAANTSSMILSQVVEKDGSLATFAIGLSGMQIKIATGVLGGTAPDYTTGDVLVDNVAGLSFAYYKGFTGTTPVAWTTADDSSLLSHIVVSLTMSAGSGINVPFTMTVNPRNNGNFGGAPPPTAENPPPGLPSSGGGGGCFVATAAYGNPYHPMVLLLKQFRDQYLAKWPGGRALIQFYYKKGPYLAAMIHDKPWACGLARVLLLPFVGLSFLLIYARGSIPLVILIMMIGAWLIIRYPARSAFMKKTIAIHNEKGSVLIGLIITMVIMATLGAAMLSLFSTSSINQTYGALSQKAYYLAESGFRYAASDLLNVTDSANDGINNDQNLEASNLNGRKLPLGAGTISLAMTPFHYAASAAALVNATSLSVQFPGGTPSYFAIPSTGSGVIGQIQIQTQTRANSTANYVTFTDYYNYSAFNTTTKTFTLSSGLVHAVPLWTSVTVLAQPSSTQTVTPSTDLSGATTANRLTLTRPAAGFFMPQYNGEFMIKGDANNVVYKYAYRDHVNDTSTTTTLYGVSMVQKNTDGTEKHTPFSVTTASYIIPKDFFTVASTGTVGNVSKTMTYVSPVDIMAFATGGGAKITSADSNTSGVNPGDTASHWYAASAGSFSVVNISGTGDKSDGTSGNVALQLTDQSTYGGGGWWWSSPTDFFSLMAIKWSLTYANFSGSWAGNSNTLSYDTQVKMYLPQRAHYMAGLVFRLNLADASPFTNSSWLGVSYALTDDTTNDYIPMQIPFTNIPMIILWQKPAGQSVAAGMNWIAYKFIAPTIYFNGGNGTFTNGSNAYYIKGGTSNARANITTVGTTDSGVTGELVVSSLYSTFQANEPLYVLTNQSNITAQVNGTFSLPSSTSISFDSGHDATGVGIKQYDIIVGQTSGAVARLNPAPTISGTGTWTNNNNKAKGTIYIDQTQGTQFTNNEYLTIYRPNTSSSAAFVSYDNLTDILTTGTNDVKYWSTLLLRIAESTAASNPFSGSDVNDIRIYVGDTAAHGTPTGSPLDTLRYADLRWSNPPVTGQTDDCQNDIQWPPDAGWSTNLSPYLCQNGTTYVDYFTLVQGWVINSSVSSTFKLTGTTEEPNSIIRTNTFTTNSLTSFTQQEIGLQVAGEGMATYGTYFEDFAVRMLGSGVSESTGLASPQQY